MHSIIIIYRRKIPRDYEDGPGFHLSGTFGTASLCDRFKTEHGFLLPTAFGPRTEGTIKRNNTKEQNERCQQTTSTMTGRVEFTAVASHAREEETRNTTNWGLPYPHSPLSSVQPPCQPTCIRLTAIVGTTSKRLLVKCFLTFPQTPKLNSAEGR